MPCLLQDFFLRDVCPPVVEIKERESMQMELICHGIQPGEKSQSWFHKFTVYYLCMHLKDLVPEGASGLRCIGLVWKGDQSAGYRERGLRRTGLKKWKVIASAGNCDQKVCGAEAHFPRQCARVM